MEVAKLLPLLSATSLQHPSFHVVTFSLPGFGFSEAPKKKGFAMAQYAEVCTLTLSRESISHGFYHYKTRSDISLCLLLGTMSMVRHRPFRFSTSLLPNIMISVTQGGDWGSKVRSAISCIHLVFDFQARSLKLSVRCTAEGGRRHGIQIFPCKLPLLQPLLPFSDLTLQSVSKPPPFWSFPWLYLKNLITPLTAQERKGLQDIQDFYRTENAYLEQQSTKPQTLGYSLAD